MFGPSTCSFAPLSHRFKVLVYVQCNPTLLWVFFLTPHHHPFFLFAVTMPVAWNLHVTYGCAGCKGQLSRIPEWILNRLWTKLECCHVYCFMFDWSFQVIIVNTVQEWKLSSFVSFLGAVFAQQSFSNNNKKSFNVYTFPSGVEIFIAKTKRTPLVGERIWWCCCQTLLDNVRSWRSPLFWGLADHPALCT